MITQRFITNLNQNYHIKAYTATIAGKRYVVLHPKYEGIRNYLGGITYKKFDRYSNNGSYISAVNKDESVFSIVRNGMFFMLLDDDYASKINAIDHAIIEYVNTHNIIKEWA